MLLLLVAGFLDRLRIELRLQGQLQGLELKPGLVQQLLKQRSTSNAEVNELRLDLSPMKQASVSAGCVHGHQQVILPPIAARAGYRSLGLEELS
jgi:hypothetical protein